MTFNLNQKVKKNKNVDSLPHDMPSYILLGGTGLQPLNRKSLPPHVGTVGDFGERIHISINFKQRLIVYLAVELILEKATVRLYLQRGDNCFEEFPSLIYWLLLFFEYRYLLFSFKAEEKGETACKEGLLSVLFCGWTNAITVYSNSKDHLKRWFCSW